MRGKSAAFRCQVVTCGGGALSCGDGAPIAACVPLFSSFRPEALRGVPGIRRALLVDPLWPGWFEIARTLGCVAVITNYNVMDAALVAQLHGAGLRALCYTVNDPPEAR